MVKVNYKELSFYSKAHQLTLEIYKLTKDFPQDERFALTSQLRRASSSIGSNIAEGCGRSTMKDFRSFLYNSLGSAKEIEYQLLLCKDLDYISINTYDRLQNMINEVIGKLSNYIKLIKV